MITIAEEHAPAHDNLSFEQRARPPARLAILPNPRDRRGRRHSLMSVLLTACAAVLTGAKSFTAVGQWAAAAPEDVLARLGARTATAFSIRIPPSTATLRRVINAVCPGGLADLLGATPVGPTTVAVDGKTARGSRTDTGTAVHLLSALSGDGQVISQLPVPDKATEVTTLAPLLDPFDLTGTLITADALHTTRDQARYIVQDKRAHYFLVVKANQPTLRAVLKSLPWKQCREVSYDRTRGHGRKETRSVRVLTITDLDLGYPFAAQAVKLLRHRTDLKTGKVTRQTVYAVTDMPSHRVRPTCLNKIARSQWGIEAVHHVRDVTFAEDASKIRSGHGPANMATIRNLAINTLRPAGHRSITVALREVSYTPFTRPLDLLKLPLTCDDTGTIGL
ncbi:ISAs1 family transposase [Streptomyces vinaceus]|uniref:ISAs1 family transposase n=1 Tax=Streptomyces vinaceus TaxID=1960 RepID=UPI0038171F5C